MRLTGVVPQVINPVSFSTLEGIIFANFSKNFFQEKQDENVESEEPEKKKKKKLKVSVDIAKLKSRTS